MSGFDFSQKIEALDQRVQELRGLAQGSLEQVREALPDFLAQLQAMLVELRPVEAPRGQGRASGRGARQEPSDRHLKERTAELEEANNRLRQELEERQQAETVLAEKSRTLEAFFQHNISPLVILDRDFNFIRVNEAYARACQREVEEFPGRNHFDFYPSDARVIFEQVVATKTPYQASARPFTFPDHPEWGETYWDWTLVPLLDGRGEVELLVFSLNDVTERVRAQETQAQLAQILEATSDLVGTAEVNGHLRYLNRAGRKMLGIGADEEISELQILDTHPGWAGAMVIGEALAAATRDGVWQGESTFLSRDGQEVPASQVIVAHKSVDGALKFFSTIARDISERRQSEAALLKANRALKTLSEGNQAVIKAMDESELLHDICRIAVEVGGYRLAWAGYAEDDPEKSVRPVAQAGYEEGYLETLKITWADQERGRGPTGTAIRTGQACTARDILTDPRFGPWRPEAVKRGYASSLVLPLTAEGRTFGALSIYAAEPDAFDAEEVRLLTELADNLTFGVMALRTRAGRQQALEALQKARDELELRVRERTAELAQTNDRLRRTIFEQRQTQETLEAINEVLRALIQAAPLAIVTVDPEGHVKLWNPAAERIFGWSEVEVLGRRYPLVPPGKEEEFQDLLERVMQGESLTDMELRCQRKDGTLIDVSASTARLTDSQGRITGIMGLLADISERKRMEDALRYSAERFKVALQAASIVVFNQDRELRYTWIYNPPPGFTAEALLGKTDFEVFHRQHAATLTEIKQKVVDSGKGSRQEVQIRKTCYDLIIEPLVDVTGNVTGITCAAVDITGRKQVEEALRETHRSLEAIVQSSPLPIIALDSQKRVKLWNPAAQRVFGWEAQEVLGQILPTVPEDRQEESWRLVDQTTRLGEAVTGVETRRRKKDGTIIDVTLHAAPMFDAEGCTTGSMGVLEDITARKQAEREISRLASFPKLNPNPILEMDPSGVFTFHNQAAHEALERLGVSGQFKKFLPPDLEEILKSAREKGEKQVYAEVAIKDAMFGLMINFIEQLQRTRLYAIDLTDRKQAEEALQASNRFLEIANRHSQLTPLLDEYVAEIKKLTGCEAVAIRILRDEGKIPYEAHHGFTPEFIAMESPLSILTDECICIKVIKGAVEPQLPFFSSGASFYLNHLTHFFATVPPAERGKTRNKCYEMGFESVALVPIKLGDRILGLVHVADRRKNMVPLVRVEVLERVAMQLGTAIQRVMAEEGLRQALEESQQAEEKIRKLNLELERHIWEVSQRTVQLEAANQELEAFSYSVSHDLRAPLRAIEGFSRMLATERAGQLDEEGHRLLEVIRNNTQIMGQLIDDLLDFSRLGRQEMRLWDLDLAALAQAVFQKLQVEHPERDLKLTLKPLPPARGDRTLIHQILVNLMDNAVKFTRPRKCAEIEVGGWTEENENIYYMKDNGVGFDIRYVDKLFGVFQRLHRSSEFEGTGVGLAIVQRIIQRHGGRVWATGKINEGATLYFSLPGKGE